MDDDEILSRRSYLDQEKLGVPAVAQRESDEKCFDNSTPDLRVRVSDTSVYPHNCIGNMKMTFVEAGISRKFNGTLFACTDHVNKEDTKFGLTAAHNIYDTKFGFAKAIDVHFGQHGANDPIPIFTVRGDQFNIPFADNLDTYKDSEQLDYAFLTLPKSVQDSLPDKCFNVRKIPTQNMLTDTHLSICGYPGYLKPRGYQWEIDKAKGGYILSDLLLYPDATSPGMSGCPVYLHNADTGLCDVIAIVKFRSILPQEPS